MNTRIKSLVAIISLVVTLIAAGTLYARANTTNRIEGDWASSNEIGGIHYYLNYSYQTGDYCLWALLEEDE